MKLADILENIQGVPPPPGRDHGGMTPDARAAATAKAKATRAAKRAAQLAAQQAAPAPKPQPKIGREPIRLHQHRIVRSPKGIGGWGEDE